MRTFRQYVSEVYTPQNMAPLSYMRQSGPVEFDDDLVANLGEHFLTDDDNADVLEALRKIVGNDSLAAEEIQDEPSEHADYFYELPAPMLARIKDYAERHSGDIYPHPTDMPTRYHFRDDAELVKRDTWLVHFTKDSSGIKRRGFTHGTDDISRLGLTALYSIDSKKRGGYNFAFEALSRYADSAAYSKKYGDEAVMFRHAGTKAYHIGDEEEQVIFYGPSVDRSGMVMLRGGVDERFDDGKEKSDISNGWGVCRTDRGGYAFVGEDFDAASKWVVRHFDQYRRVIS